MQTAVSILTFSKHLNEIYVWFSDFPPFQSETDPNLDKFHRCFDRAVEAGSCPDTAQLRVDYLWWGQHWLGTGHHFLLFENIIY